MGAREGRSGPRWLSHRFGVVEVDPDAHRVAGGSPRNVRLISPQSNRGPVWHRERKACFLLSKGRQEGKGGGDLQRTQDWRFDAAKPWDKGWRSDDCVCSPYGAVFSPNAFLLDAATASHTCGGQPRPICSPICCPLPLGFAVVAMVVVVVVAVVGFVKDASAPKYREGVFHPYP